MNKKREYQKRPTKNLFRKNGKWGYDIQILGRRYIRLFDSRVLRDDALTALKHEKKLEEIYGKPSPQKISFREFVEKFLDHPEIKEKKSFVRDETAADLHLVPFFGAMLLSDITAEQVERYIIKRKGEKTRRGTLTNGATINREISLLKTIINRAVEWEHLNIYPVIWKRIKKLEERGRTRVLDFDEAERLLKSTNKDRTLIRPYLIIALNTGLRKTEILSLTWDRIDFRRREMVVKRQKKRPGDDPYHRIPVNQYVIDALSGIKRVPESEYIFANGNSKTGYVKEIRRAFKTACDRAEIKGLRPHDLRRTFATNLDRKGIGLVTIQKLLGHSSSKMTQAYIKDFSEDLRRAVDSLSNIPIDSVQDKAAEKLEGRKKDESHAVEAPEAEYIQ